MSVHRGQKITFTHRNSVYYVYYMRVRDRVRVGGVMVRVSASVTVYSMYTVYMVSCTYIHLVDTYDDFSWTPRMLLSYMGFAHRPLH